jgi:hypothetical protein
MKQASSPGDTMTYRGHVKNGRITLDPPANLPEGAELSIEIIEPRNGKPRPRNARVRTFQPIEMPGGSLADELVRERR